MSTTQLFLVLAGTLFVIYMDARFTSIDKKLDFLLEHFADHESRISKVGERTNVK